MESVPAACAPQFTGQAGALFAHALGAVIAAHCARAGPQWPPDDAQQIINAGGGSYDFIIVGAGTAGCLVANRLAQVPVWKILLIEAGDDPTFDSEVPAFLFSNQDTKQDWQHRTSQNPNHCLASENGACKWAKGKGMGGSSSINAMLYVRGNKADYDEWERAGNPGWEYAKVLPYFMKTENFSKRNNIEDAHKFHGTSGQMYVEPFGEPKNPWKEVISQAWKEIGYNYNEDINGESQIGISNVPGSVKDGMRHNSAKQYLINAKGGGNLHVMKNTIVTKLIIDPDTKICTGVEVRHRNGKIVEITAIKEVILTAGTIKSPQILLLSGIGPKVHLKEMNITTIVNLAVGKNLQDHPIFPVFVQVPERLSTRVTDEEVTMFILQYMLTRTGPFRGIGMTDLLGFVDTMNNSQVPDIQFHHIYFSKDDRVILPAYRSTTGYVDDFWDNLSEINRDNDLLGIYPTLIHPKSRGEVILKNTDPLENPEIHANYLHDQEDINTLLRGVDFVYKLLNTSTFESVGLRIPRFNLKACADKIFGSEEYWGCYIRNVASTIYHPVGTNKMGVLTDSGVVDEQLRVHGVARLRVIDASIMPVIPRGNTMAPTLMVAEKGAEMVKKHWFGKEKIEL